MLQNNGQTYFTTLDLATRYNLSSTGTISKWVNEGKIPPHDFIGYHGTYLWNVNTIFDWEKKHGGNLEEFKKVARIKHCKEARFYLPFSADNSAPAPDMFMFATVPSQSDSVPVPASKTEENDSSEFKPVSQVVSQLLGDSQMSFNDLAELNPDMPVNADEPVNSSDLAVSNKISCSDDDSDIEFFTLQERVIKLDGDIAELRQTVKELAGVIADLSMSLTNSAGLLYGRVKVVNLKLKRFNDSSTDENSKLEGTDE